MNRNKVVVIVFRVIIVAKETSVSERETNATPALSSSAKDWGSIIVGIPVDDEVDPAVAVEIRPMEQRILCSEICV